MLVLAISLLAAAGCSGKSKPPDNTAFEDCYNQNPLTRTQQGCEEGGDH